MVVFLNELLENPTTKIKYFEDHLSFFTPGAVLANFRCSLGADVQQKDGIIGYIGCFLTLCVDGIDYLPQKSALWS